MSEKIQTNIYLLRENIRIKRGGKLTNLQLDYKSLKFFLKGKGFIEQKVKNDLEADFEIKVFHKKTNTEVKWKEFIHKVVAEGEQILKENKSWIESFIILFINDATGKIFASTGGYANATMQEIATNDFGIEILSRIVNNEEKTLKSTTERNLTGGIQGEIKYFRNDYNLFDNDSFGKVYNELNALLTAKNLQKHFGFDLADLKNDSVCIAKNFFSIKKSISFQELETLVHKCEYLLSQKRIVEINSIDKISRKDSLLLENLEDQVLNNLYNNYCNENEHFSVEISHRDFDKYFQGSSSNLEFTYKRKKQIVEFEGCFRNIQEIFSTIDEEIPQKMMQEDFVKVIRSAVLKTFDSEGNDLTFEKLYNHFCTEVSFNDNVYFLMEKEWYVIKKSFLNEINKQTKYFLDEKRYNGPTLIKWTNSSENDYNSTYIGIENTFVFDKIIPQKIEACDMLKVDKDIVYFYHIKKGFDNSMRDLCNQVFIASRRVFEDIKSEFEFLKLLYRMAKNNKGKTPYMANVKKQFENITESEFVTLLKGKKIVFVLAVLDSAKTERDLFKDIEKFDSNIAKFTLIELTKNMNSLGAEFQIAQLFK